MKKTAIVRGGKLVLDRNILNLAGFEDGDVVQCKMHRSLIEVRGRANLRHEDTADVDKDGRPIPPDWLREIVVGHRNVDSFIKSGDEIMAGFARLVTKADQDLSEYSHILDFGSGCGRILRALPKYTNARLVGCDLVPEAITWCQKNMDGKFLVGQEYPPLPLEDNRFDLIYAVSVLTHLDADHQYRWLEEWCRLARPGGLLIVTFRGESAVENESPDLQKEVADGWRIGGGIYYRTSRYWQGVYPSYYQGTYHTYDYVHQHWSRFFEVVDIFPRGSAVTNQDIALLRKAS